MSVTTEKHDGICGHCQSSVPETATVCTGCEATWSLKNGYTREQLYNLNNGLYNTSKVLFVLSGIVLLFYLGAIMTNSLSQEIFSGIVLPIGSGLVFFLSAIQVFVGLMRRSMAKNGQVGWYRRIP